MNIARKARRLGLCIALIGLASGWAAPALSLELSVETGPDYGHTKWFGIVPVKLVPQMAVWIEDGNGTYVDTVYVTRSSAANSWKGGASVRRPEALPVWSHRRGVKAKDGLYMPASDSPLPDAVSGATRKAGFSIAYGKALAAGSYRLLLEVNSSYDYNSVWREGLKAGDPHYSGVNGQPSLVYACDFSVGPGAAQVSKAGELELSPFGQGSATGQEGSMVSGTAGLDSALGILSGLKLKVVQ
jgi:hypothetical protein